MKPINNTILFLFVSIFTILCLSTDTSAEVSLFGITLGEKLNVKKCRKQIEYECYTTNDVKIADICITKLSKKLSFYADININFEKKCDRNSRVSDLYIKIAPYDFEKIFSLMVKKFGEPQSIEESTVSNHFGTTFIQKEAFWSIEDCEIYLARYGDTIKNGILVAAHKIAIDKHTEKKQNDANSDALNF